MSQDEDRAAVMDAALAGALLMASKLTYGNRQDAEDLVRNRLVAVADSNDNDEELLASMNHWKNAVKGAGL